MWTEAAKSSLALGMSLDLLGSRLDAQEAAQLEPFIPAQDREHQRIADRAPAHLAVQIGDRVDRLAVDGHDEVAAQAQLAARREGDRHPAGHEAAERAAQRLGVT